MIAGYRLFIQYADKQRGTRRVFPPLCAFFCLFFFLACAGGPYNAFNRGLQCIENGCPDRAEEIFLTVVKSEPANAEAWNQLGILAFERSDLELAEIRFAKAYALAPHRAAYVRNLSYVFAERRDYGRAMEMLRRSLEIDADDPETWITVAKVEKLRNRPDAALDALRKVLEIHPAYPGAAELRDRWENDVPAPYTSR